MTKATAKAKLIAQVREDLTAAGQSEAQIEAALTTATFQVAEVSCLGTALTAVIEPPDQPGLMMFRAVSLAPENGPVWRLVEGLTDDPLPEEVRDILEELIADGVIGSVYLMACEEGPWPKTCCHLFARYPLSKGPILASA